MNNVEQLSNLAKYYRDLLFSLSSQVGKHFVDINAVLRYGLTADLSLFISEIEELISSETISFTIEKASPSVVTKIIEKANEIEDKEEQGVLSEDIETSIEEQARKNASAILVAIYRKQEFDPYNREVIIGFPIISGKIGKKKFCAPLFYYKVHIDFNPLKSLITLTKDFEIPALNFQLIKHLVESDEDIEMIRQQILPHLYREDFGLSTIQEIIQKLSELIEGFRGITYVPHHSSLKEALELREYASARILNTSIIVNARRTNAYLLDDLTQLAQIKEIDDETVIDAILSEPLDKEDIEDTEDSNESEDQSLLLFPLLSNKAQRLSAVKAEKARLLVIQGPPGTGKSQTIVNLICHLVAQGKTVLVTSHQNKALEVITKNMPPIDYLAMSLLKGEKESINELTNKIEGFHSYVSSVNVSEYTKRIQAYMPELKKKDSDIKRLQLRFSELKIIEREQYPSYRKYHEIREYDLVDSRDSIPEGMDSIVSQALSEYSTLLRKLKDNYSDIEKILSDYSTTVIEGDYLIIKCKSCNTKNKVPKEKLQFNLKCGQCGQSISIQDDNSIEKFRQFIYAYDWMKDNLFTNKDILEFCRQFSEFSHCREDIIEYLDNLIQWTDKYCNKLISAVKLLSESYNLKIDFCTVKRQFAKFGTEISDVLNCIEDILSKLQLLKDHKMEDIHIEYPDGLILKDATSHLENFTDSANSWWKWNLSTKARKARKFFISIKFPKVTYKKRIEFLEKIKAWHHHWTLRYQVSKKYRYLTEMEVPIKGLSSKPSLGELYKNVNLAQKYSQIIVACNEFPSIQLEKIKNLTEKQVGDITSSEDISKFKECLERSKIYIEQIQNLDKLKSEKHFAYLFNNLFSPVEEAICHLVSDEKADKIVNRLKELYPYFHDYKRFKIIEQTVLKTLPNTCSLINNEILHGNDVAALKNPELIVEAFRLSYFIREDLLKNPDDINEITTRIRELKEETRVLIRKMLDTSRKHSLKDAESNRKTLFMINKLKQILKRKRKTYSFVQLRDQIEYKRLLSVFPCWIMSIEDVARIFPLQAGLFDYLIVDEASQCNQATALHLAYRAKRMIVVGDSKQMKNPNTQFLSDSVVRLNLTKHNLDKHPKAEFLHGRNSLLDLAIGCQDVSPIFLDEHFRCEPPIIEFSNKHFYNNNLKVLTPFRRRRFNPCMEIRVLNGSYDDPDNTKQNVIEAKTVIAELKRVIDNGELEGDRKGEKLSVGILSPFRQQATLLQSMMYEIFEDRPFLLKEHEIIASTVDGFQGDERDVILYSFRYAPNSKPGTIHVLQREDEHSLGRLNVAFSRARRKVICFISLPKDNFPKGLIKDYLTHVALVQSSSYSRLGNPNEREKCQSDFERNVFDDLVEKGLEVYAQVSCAGFSIDFVVINKDGRRIAVECDGDFHYEDDDLREEDYQRQDIIERYGWFVHRIPSRRYYANPQKAIDNLLEDLQKQEIDKEISYGEVANETFIEPVQISIQETIEESKPSSKESSRLAASTSIEDKIIGILSEEGPMPIWKIAQKLGQPKEEITPIMEKLLEQEWVINYYENGVKLWKAID